MQYMIIETYTHGPGPVYARFRERGRMAPDGLRYVSSVVTADGNRCYQIMECDDRTLRDPTGGMATTLPPMTRHAPSRCFQTRR